MRPGNSKLTKFKRLSTADKWLLIRAAYGLGIARLMLANTSFQKLAERLGSKGAKGTRAPDSDYSERVGYAVHAAASAVPWRADCFPQAIAARMLLKREGYDTTIHLGVTKGAEGNIAGHAWLTCGDYVVTGAGELDHYTEMHRISA